MFGPRLCPRGEPRFAIDLYAKVARKECRLIAS